MSYNGLSVRIETITPERASNLLLMNTHNRDLNDKRVKQLVGAIQRGEWKINGDCIVFTGNGDGGVLLNGQHRLRAVAVSGISIRAAVMYGAGFEAQETMDSGMTRSLPSKLKLRGEKYYVELGPALRLAWHFDLTGAPYSPRLVAPTDHQLFHYLDDNPDIRYAPPLGRALSGAFLSPAGSWSGFIFLFRRAVGQDLADLFFRRLMEGSDLPAEDPIFVLRRLLLRQRATNADRRFGEELMAAHLVKSFNAFCLGQTIRILKYDNAREGFPSIVTVEDLAG